MLNVFGLKRYFIFFYFKKLLNVSSLALILLVNVVMFVNMCQKYFDDRFLFILIDSFLLDLLVSKSKYFLVKSIS